MFGALWPVLLVVGALLVVAAVSQSWGFLGWLAAAAFAGAGLLRAMSGAGRDASRRVHRDHGGITVEMRRDFPVTALAFASTLALLFGLNTPSLEDRAGQVAGLVGCLLAVVPLPDLTRAALTRCHLRADARRIVIRSWSTEAVVDWTDVAEVDVDTSVPSRPAVSIQVRPSAHSLEARRRRILVPLEPRHPRDQLNLTALAFDEPWLLASWLDRLTGLTPEDRANRLTESAVALLTAKLPHSS